MLSIDTNLIFYSLTTNYAEHPRALKWMTEISQRKDIAISEFVLVELYRLLRNPSLNDKPLNGKEATSIIERYREHPHWRIIGFTEKSSCNAITSTSF